MHSEQNVRREKVYRFTIFFQSLILFIALILPPILKKYPLAGDDVIIVISNHWWFCITIPIVVLVLMTFLPDLIYRKFKKNWFFSIYVLCAILLGSLLFTINDFLGPYRSSKVAKEIIAMQVPTDRDLYQYKINFYGIDFYNKIRTHIVQDFGELSEGIAKMPEKERKYYFLSAEEFFRLCDEKKDIYCITRFEERLKELKQKYPRTEVLWNNKAFYLLHIKI